MYSGARGLRRWLAFNAVGAMGVAVQLVTLVALTEAAGLDYRVATVLAVETAILHNFLWHERWTWRDRVSAGPGPWARLAWFNLLTGTLSISANVVFTTLYVSALDIHYTLANLLAIASCSLLNFIANDRFVFRVRAAPPARFADRAPMAGEGEGEPDSNLTERERERPTMITGTTGATRQVRRPAWRRATLRGGLAVVLVAAVPADPGAAELKDATIAAWQRYVEATEQRIARELGAGGAFLVQDFGDDAAAARRDVLAGNVRVDRMETREAAGRRIAVPGGAIHHWRGSVLIPGVTLDDVLNGLLHGANLTKMQNGVVESRVIDRDGYRLRVFLKLRRRQLVTVHYNTEHHVQYTRHRTGAASSRSVSTRIAELVDAGSPAEHEKPIGRDRGFLWRLNSYWRYQQAGAGVIVECESVSLSRDIPRAIRWMAAPIINRTARQLMTRTLTSMAVTMSAPAPNGIEIVAP